LEDLTEEKPKTQQSGEIGRHDWTVKQCKNPEEGWQVHVDDRHIGNRESFEEAKAYAMDLIARADADGGYRLNEMPAGFLPPPFLQPVPPASHQEAPQEKPMPEAAAQAEPSAPLPAIAAADLPPGSRPYMLKMFKDVQIFSGDTGAKMPEGWTGVAVCHATSGFVAILRGADGKAEATPLEAKNYAAALAEAEPLLAGVRSPTGKLKAAPAEIEAAKTAELDAGTPEGYAQMPDDPALQHEWLLKWQDRLDAVFQERIPAIRNALREHGWEGGHRDPLLTRFDGEIFLQQSFSYTQVGAGANVVGMDSVVKSQLRLAKAAVVGEPLRFRDDLSMTPQAFAAKIDEEATKHAEAWRLRRGSEVEKPADDTGASIKALIDNAEKPAPTSFATDPPKAASPKEAWEAMDFLKAFVCRQQWRTMASLMKGEEGPYFMDKAVEMAATIKAMPATYGQDGLGGQAVAHLHYFKGPADWFVTEKDMGDPKNGDFSQAQAFGMADLGHGGELGYISIDALVENSVELDLHWTPKTLDEIERSRHGCGMGRGENEDDMPDNGYSQAA
jgi:hypothetical protein